MTDLPANLKYADTHEWVRVENTNLVRVGITDFAQEQLGDLVFIQLPETGRKLAQNEQCATLESVKTASDLYSPVTGVVVETNQDAIDEPQLVNENPYGTWLFCIQTETAANLSGLMDAEAYRKAIED